MVGEITKKWAVIYYYNDDICAALYETREEALRQMKMINKHRNGGEDFLGKPALFCAAEYKLMEHVLLNRGLEYAA